MKIGKGNQKAKRKKEGARTKGGEQETEGRE